MTHISLRDITFETVRDVTNLKVGPNQRGYVAPNAVSIAEAHFNPGAWFRGIYADQTPVGFVMLFDPVMPGAVSRTPINDDEVMLWRLMIDHRFQRMGFGKRALDLVCGHVRGLGRANNLLSSYVPGPGGPENFYLGYGFQKTWRFRNHGREIEIVLPLN